MPRPQPLIYYANGESPIERLPYELKLEVLLRADFPALFNICAAIRSFKEIYEARTALIQRTIILRDHSTEALRLLDRFRPSPNGMGVLSVVIFAHFHSWIDEDQFFGCFAHAEELEEARLGFGTEDGVVSNLAEARFLVELEAYVDMLYTEARWFGYRDTRNRVSKLPPKSNQDEKSLRRRKWVAETLLVTPEDGNDDEETRERIRRSLFQFVLITTYFHDKSFSKQTVIDGSRKVERIEAVEAYMRQTWLSATESKEEGLEYQTPPTMYDYSYIKELSISDVATILSVAAPVVNYLYNPPSNRYRPYNDQKEDFRDLRVVRLFHLNRCVPPQYVVRYFDPENPEDEFEKYTEARLFMKTYKSAVGSGAWRDDYTDRVHELKRGVAAFRSLKWRELHEARFRERQILFSRNPQGIGRVHTVYSDRGAFLEDETCLEIAGILAALAKDHPAGYTIFRFPDLIHTLGMLSKLWNVERLRYSSISAESLSNNLIRVPLCVGRWEVLEDQCVHR
ncbi:hypothetical protein BJ508DRAFT_338831 [Ascobolus immersus RN42]|uniref:F-box domain-containing protein n=1 Tax=Ascobolus immersus RN42 TaxID=1160509 RepID=A0A3N4IFF0_ASCIM|nr:hypothetical protein BJ508DRAFT_338831 [Ascobolus immersus RN42]